MMALPEVNGYQLIDLAGNVQTQVRDRQLDLVSGRPTTCTIPASGVPTFDEYGDPLEATTTTTIAIKTLPLLDKYYMLLDLFGKDDELNLPLEVIVDSKVNLPEGSLMTFDWIKTDSTRLAKVWEVISSEVKFIEHIYSKVLKVVPKRGLRVEENVDE